MYDFERLIDQRFVDYYCGLIVALRLEQDRLLRNKDNHAAQKMQNILSALHNDVLVFDAIELCFKRQIPIAQTYQHILRDFKRFVYGPSK